MRIASWLAAGSVLALSGCGNFNSIYRTHRFEADGSAIIDVKQRLVVVGKGPTPTDGKVIACAEPSPDALSAYAAELAGSTTYAPGQTADLALAARESSSYVGLRTQSIQLLRDAAYRICEGYLNGILTAPQYDILMRRHQKIMVSLLAIEQLTAVVKVPAVTIDASSFAAAATRFEAEKKLAAIDADLNKKETLRSAAKTAKTDTAVLDAEILELKQQRQLAEKTEGIASGVVVGGISTANVAPTSSTQQTQNIREIALVVQKIVDDIVMKSQDLRELCILNLLEGGGTAKQNKSLDPLCSEELNKERLSLANQDLQAKNAALSTSLEGLKNNLQQLKTQNSRYVEVAEKLNRSAETSENEKAQLLLELSLVKTKLKEVQEKVQQSGQAVTQAAGAVSTKADAVSDAANSVQTPVEPKNP